MNDTSSDSRSMMKIVKRPIIAFVVIPWLVYAFYLAVIASPLYESRSQLILKTSNSNSAFDPSSILLGGLSGVSVSNDAKLVETYVLSRDIMLKLDEKLEIRDHYVNSGADFFSRLSSNHSEEDFLAFFQKHVDVKVEQLSGVISINAMAFDPAFAKEINVAIVEFSEQFINNINNELAKVQLEFAQQEHLSIEQNLELAKQQLLAFQSKYDLVDPTVEGAAFQQITYGLESALVQKRAELNGVQAIMASNAPAVINLQRDIAALEQQIQQERERISDSDKTGQQQSMSELIAEFGNLRIQLELQTQTFAASLAALEKTRVETYQQLQHLVTIETSTLPDENKYPRVTYNLTLAAILLLLTFGIVRIIIATVREFSY